MRIATEGNDHAVSELIGAILLVALVITAMAIVAVLVLSNPPPEEVPHLNALAGNTSDTILLYHTGGDELKEEQTLIRINNNPDPIPHSEIYLKSEDGTVESSPWGTTKTQWGVGKTLVIPSPFPPQSITVTYQGPTSQHLILSTSFVAGKWGFNSTGSGPGMSCRYVDAAFSASPITGVAPLTVQFNDLSSGDPTIWSWNFGDGNVSSNKNPIHTFWTQGSYPVSLNASKNEPNCTNSDTQILTIIVTPPPPGCIPVNATFYGTPTSGLLPLIVQFTDTSTGSPTNWSWNFGDGATSNLQNPNHTYISLGNFTVSLNVSKNEPNCSSPSVLTFSNYIQVRCPQVVATFIGEPRTGKIPLTVKFTDTSTGNPTSWFWSFGDGGTSNDQNPEHQYTTIGPFTVILNASNNCGNSNAIRYLNYISPSLSGTGNVINFTKMCGARGYLKGGTYYQFGDSAVGSITINGKTYTDLKKKVVKLVINGDQPSGHLYMDHPNCNDFSFNVKMYADEVLIDTGPVDAITAQVNKNNDESTLTYVLDPSCIAYTHLIINSKDVINQDNNGARMEISNMTIIHDNKDPYVNKFIINLDGSHNQINTQGDIVVY